jgi:hypothetical protein
LTNPTNSEEEQFKSQQKMVLNIVEITFIGFIALTFLLAGLWDNQYLRILLIIFDIALFSGFFITIYLYLKLKLTQTQIFSRQEGKKCWKYGRKNLFLLFSLVCVSIAILLILLFYGGEENIFLSVPMVIIFAVVAFLGVLTTASVVLDFFELSNKNEALGLPTGSVRALIALTLILIFAIMVVFMATNLQGVQEKIVPAGEIFYYGGQELTNPDADITILLEPSQAAIDFSKQVLTTISTLVVALAGFYFGTRSVAQAQRTTAETELTIDPPSPATIDLSVAEQETLEITVSTKPVNEAIEFRIDGDSNDSVTHPSINKFIYKPSNALIQDLDKSQQAKQVTITFYMVNYRGDTEDLLIQIIPARKKINTNNPKTTNQNIKPKKT